MTINFSSHSLGSLKEWLGVVETAIFRPIFRLIND